MISHLSLGTNDPGRARAFYDPLMALIGLRSLRATETALDYGIGTFLFSLETPANGQPATAGNGAHVAFSVENRATVDSFYRLAMENGGSDAGPPGIRPHYDADYYAAFVRDPDGNKLEAVTFSAK